MFIIYSNSLGEIGLNLFLFKSLNSIGYPFSKNSVLAKYSSLYKSIGTSRTALCENMGVTETYLRKHYSKYLTRLATADLMKMDKDIGLGGKIISLGNEFAIA